MEVLSHVFAGWTISRPAALVILLAAVALLYFFAARVRAGARYGLRHIRGYEALQRMVGQAAELGQALHMAPGIGGIGGTNTLETLAGLTTLEYLAQQAALCDTPLLVNVADPTTIPAAQGALRRGYAQAGYPDEYNPNQVRFIAPDPVAYAAGVMLTLEQQKLAGNVMIGAFGDEFLLMGETGARKRVLQVGGTTDSRALPLVYVSVDHALIGEEIFAGGAYLSRHPNHIGSLATADVIRSAIVVAVVIGVVLKTLGYL